MKLFTIVVIFFYVPISLQAEITLDGTLGRHTALPGPDYIIGAELGQQRGDHLFHSFEQFDLNANERATFSGPNTVNNIISRVTGGSPSTIDGTLRSTIPNANLYFLNPYGIMFGGNATLDLSGSFHATTADTIYFSDGSQFNARNPSVSHLTIAPLSAFGFLTEFPQSFSLENSHLQLSAGKMLSLIGGELHVSGGSITVPSGRINLASLAEPGEISIFTQDLPLTTQKNTLTLENTTVDISGGGGESGIYIRAGQFFLENTTVSANTEGVESAGKIDVQTNTLIASDGGRFANETTGAGAGGTVKIQVSGLTEFSGESVDGDGELVKSGISVVSREEGGEGGNVELETVTLSLKDGGFVSAATYGQGQGGNISIRATDTVALTGADSEGKVSFIAANTYGKIENAGNGGIIDIGAKEIQLMDGATIQNRTLGTGHSGQIYIHALDTITLAGEGESNTSRISSSSKGSGNGGLIHLETNQLNLLEGAFITADTENSGTGGDIDIQSNILNLNGLDDYGYGSLITASTGKDATGKGGNIAIHVNRLSITDGAQITTSTFGAGHGGDLTVKAQEMMLSGQDQSEEALHSGILTTTEGETKEAGEAGSINLTTNILRLTDTAQIDVGTFGTGQGGNIHIQAHAIDLTSEGNITAKSEGQGNAGEIILEANQINLKNRSSIKTSALEAGGGNIELSSQNFVYIKKSQITTSVQSGVGDGGNITVTKPTFTILNEGYVKAQADAGHGGEINLNSEYYIKTPNSIVNASSKVGIDGKINITALDENVSNSITVISTNFIPDDELEAFCSKYQLLEDQMSHFIVTLPLAGKPASPEDWQASSLPSD